MSSIELIKKAKELGGLPIIDYDEVSFRYKVSIDNVWYREKNSYLKLPLFGQGFSIEDACYDYIRKARGGLMVHVISDKLLEVV